MCLRFSFCLEFYTVTDEDNAFFVLLNKTLKKMKYKQTKGIKVIIYKFL